MVLPASPIAAMYAGEDGDLCVELGYVGKALPALKANQPDISKAGGLPAWFGEAPAGSDDVVCRLCRRDLFLVTQIYAPTHVQRSLCVFGCNRPACSVQPQGWRVIRTQTPQHNLQPTRGGADAVARTARKSNGLAAAGVVPPAPPIPSRPSEPAAEAWGANDESWDACGGRDDWGAEDGEWGAVGSDGGGDEATAAIDVMLAEHERRSTKKVRDEAARSKPCVRDESAAALGGDEVGSEAIGRRHVDTTLSSETECVAGRCFPAKAVNFLPEPWAAECSLVEDKDMENRLRRYRDQEEDRGLVAALDQALGLKNGARGHHQGPRGGEGASNVGEKYERTPARAKAVMRFADRVARSPQQVVRYAYGGQPLWSTSDPPKEDVPPCACGATRVFEMQLMPALLLQLQVNNFADPGTCEQDNTSAPDTSKRCTANEAVGDKSTKMTPSAISEDKGSSIRPTDDCKLRRVVQEHEGGAARVVKGGQDDEDSERTMPTPTVEERERLRTWGMDWGVVAVWCCPRSCEGSCEEVVVVQLPV